MPCETVSQVTVKVEKMQVDLLMAALTDLKLGPRLQGRWIWFGNREHYDANTGDIKIDQFRDINEIKRAYSAQIVKTQAKKFGWTLKQTGPLEYELLKR